MRASRPPGPFQGRNREPREAPHAHPLPPVPVALPETPALALASLADVARYGRPGGYPAKGLARALRGPQGLATAPGSTLTPGALAAPSYAILAAPPVARVELAATVELASAADLAAELAKVTP